MTKHKARVLVASTEGVAEAGRVLASGRLCAFPTETVYGLGANALDEKAVLSIFEAKRRPLTDPLIVHVPSAEKALALLATSEAEARVFESLTKAFWPGPLTLVAKAIDSVPSYVSAGTGTVGVRCPSHEVALKVLEAAGVPVAAPSANVFGHVSPTSAKHVLDDLGDLDICVLDADADAPCEHGIESTVCKIETSDGATGVVVKLYRRGAVAARDVRAVVESCSALFVDESVRRVQPPSNDHSRAEVAPGQLLTHYAPRLPSVLARLASDDDATEAAAAFDDAVVVDFAARLKPLESAVLAYRDLSPAGDAARAAADLFETLRWAEDVPGATRVFIADLSAQRTGDDLLAGVADRLFRAASGRRLTLRLLPPDS